MAVVDLLTASLAAAGLTLAARLGGEKRLPILIFHRVRPEADPLFPGEIDAARFDRLLRLVGRSHRVLPLGEAVRRLRDGRLPPRALSISFDDGYADNAEVALPLLQRHGMSASFFIATGFIGGGLMWNDAIIEAVRRSPLQQADLAPLGLEGVQRVALQTEAQRAALIERLIRPIKYLTPAERAPRIAHLRALLQAGDAPRDLMMDLDQLRRLQRAGMEIGAHTVNHPILATLTPAQARSEMAEGKAQLEQWLDAPVRLFAYPNGRPDQDYRAEHAQLARELGFEAAVSTAPGIATRGDDPFQLPRFTPWRRPGAAWVGQLVKAYREPYRVAA
ncbi:polysaccharide deacetylase family protein [Pelomonas sp. CA6]|uniref:polysaccharide deacetylase family protein n=1 Tax=Pelomonas sp. CA6 TaxID=2907999 RepID=UPI001F4C4D81|nr:polysaccharide deacetylase family protein [Pelomonas sp. CA6]MCH7344170.1 polysaccharide deacetylase family protein [Pelomonas sp. CA6]